MEKVFESYIKTIPERLWRAITVPGLRGKYNFGLAVTSDWPPGSRYEGGPPGMTILEGESLVVDPVSSRAV